MSLLENGDTYDTNQAYLKRYFLNIFRKHISENIFLQSFLHIS